MKENQTNAAKSRVTSSDLFGWELLHAASRWILDNPNDWDHDDIPMEVVAYWAKVRATLKDHRDEHGDLSHSLLKHAGIILATHYKHTFEPEPNAKLSDAPTEPSTISAHDQTH